MRLLLNHWAVGKLEFPFPKEFEDFSYSRKFVWIGRVCGPLMFHLRVKSTDEYGCYEMLKSLSLHSFDCYELLKSLSFHSFDCYELLKSLSLHSFNASDMSLCCFSHSSQTLAIISITIGSKESLDVVWVDECRLSTGVFQCFESRFVSIRPGRVVLHNSSGFFGRHGFESRQHFSASTRLTPHLSMKAANSVESLVDCHLQNPWCWFGSIVELRYVFIDVRSCKKF